MKTDPSAKAPVAHRWVILAILFTTRTVVGFHFQSVPALGPVLVQELGIDYALLGTVIGFFMLPGVVFALPGGVLGQRFGDMRIAVIGLTLMVLGGVLLAVGSSVPLLAAARLFSGIGAVFLNTVLAKMVTDWFAEREIVLAMAIFVTSWPVGIGLALISLPGLATITSTSVALGSTAVLSGVALALLLAAYRVPAGLVAAPATFRIQLSGREWALSILSGMVWGFYNVGLILVLVFGPSLFTSQGMPIGTAGATASIVSWTMLISLPLGGYIAQRLNAPNAVMGGSFIALAVAGSALAAGASPVLICLVFGVLAGPPPGPIMGLPGAALRPQNRAAGMGVYYAAYYGAMAGLVPAAGAVRDATESASAPLYFAAAMMLAATISLAGFRFVQREAATTH
jgi:predicted MFS family arabinose efflux permease